MITKSYKALAGSPVTPLEPVDGLMVASATHRVDTTYDDAVYSLASVELMVSGFGKASMKGTFGITAEGRSLGVHHAEKELSDVTIPKAVLTQFTKNGNATIPWKVFETLFVATMLGDDPEFEVDLAAMLAATS